jgi:hypothetical protein
VHIGRHTPEVAMIRKSFVEAVRIEAGGRGSAPNAFGIQRHDEKLVVKCKEPGRTLLIQRFLRTLGRDEGVRVVSRDRKVSNADTKVIRVSAKEALHDRLDTPDEGGMKINELHYSHQSASRAATRSVAHRYVVARLIA